MKAFLSALIIFVLMATIITVNAIFTSKYANDVIHIADSFPKESIDGAQEKLDTLREYFTQKEFFIMTTNNHARVHDIYKIFSQIQAAILSDDFSLYTQSRLALYDAVRVLSEFNKFSLTEIF